jgi:hypothetical protein
MPLWKLLILRNSTRKSPLWAARSPSGNKEISRRYGIEGFAQNTYTQLYYVHDGTNIHFPASFPNLIFRIILLCIVKHPVSCFLTFYIEIMPFFTSRARVVTCLSMLSCMMLSIWYYLVKRTNYETSNAILGCFCLFGSRSSRDSVTTRLQTGRSAFRIPVGRDTFLLHRTSRSSLVPEHPPIHWVLAFPPGP